MVTWQVMRGSDGKVEVVEGYETLDEAIADMAEYRDDTTNQWGNFITDEEDRIVAVALYAWDGLLVACADGRQLRFEMKGSHKE
jgi:hypothetical protein